MRLSNTLLEQDGEIVDHGIAAPHLLHELRAHAQHHAAEMLRLAAREDGFKRGPLAAGITRCGNAVHDDLFLELGFLVCRVEAAEGSDDGFAFRVAFAGQEPARRLGEPDHGDDEDEGEDDLEGDGETPG